MGSNKNQTSSACTSFYHVHTPYQAYILLECDFLEMLHSIAAHWDNLLLLDPFIWKRNDDFTMKKQLADPLITSHLLLGQSIATLF